MAPARRQVEAAEPGSCRLPALPERLVARPRVRSMLEAAVERPVTLVSAPAGTGKTVAVAGWALDCPTSGPVVWVTVGPADLGGAGLWALVVEELHHHGLTVGSPLPGPGSLAYDRVFLFALARQLARRPDPLVLVVDAECPLPAAAGAGLHYLVQHAAGRVRLVLLTRQEPPLPVWRYRLSGRVAELGMAELAFTGDEARALLRAHGVTVPGDAGAELLRRTRGWAVGLTLAAQQTLADPGAGVTAVRGDSGPVAEYLLSEVLEPQPAGVRSLLLQTSGVDLLEPGLVEALAGRRAPRVLSELLHRNVLLEPVPDMPGSYRYHPLFRELLHSRLVAESPERAVDLDRVATAWKAGNGRLHEAVAGAARRNAWGEASGYVVAHLGVAELLANPAGPVAGTFARMPGSVPGAAAALVRAARCLAESDLASSAAHLDRARGLAGSEATPAMRSGLAVVQLRLAAGSRDWSQTLRLADAAEAALAQQSETAVSAHPELVALVAVGRATAWVGLGDLEAAARALEAAQGPVAGRWPGLVAEIHGLAALVAAWQGRLTRAVQHAGKVPSPGGHPGRAAPGPADVTLAWVATERYDGSAAPLLAAPQLATLPDSDLARGMLALARARAQRRRGDLDRSLAELTDPRLDALPGWLADQVRIETAFVHLASGSGRLAAGALAEVGAPSAEAVVVRSRLALTERGRPAVPPYGREDGVAPLAARVSMELVRSAALLEQRDHRRALATLTRALRLADPERLRRPFEEAPAEVLRLLRSTDLRARHPWLGPGPGATPAARTPATSAPRAPTPVLVEPLTGREREVLVLLADLLTTEEIAGTLFVSVNTVRTHVRSILRKLGATRRNEAIRRARTLRILPDQPTHVGITHYG